MAGTRRVRRVLLILTLVVALLVVALLGDVLAIWLRFTRVPLTMPPATAAEQTWVILGIDDRSAKPDGPDDYGQGKDQPGVRADIAVALTKRAAGWQIISLPRDLILVGENPVTERLAIAYGKGPQYFIDRLCVGTNIAASHLVVFNFRAFVKIVDALGGIEVTIPEAIRDQPAHLDLAAGKQRVDGRTAMALVRSRQAEVLRDGKWVEDVDGNAARQRNAVLMIKQVADQLRSAGPIELQRVAWAASEEVIIDEGTDLLELAQLRTVSGPIIELKGKADPSVWSFYPTAETDEQIKQLGFTQRCKPA